MKAGFSPITMASIRVRPAAPRSSAGQSPMRTGLLKVGLPGQRGAVCKGPTLADLLKLLGYVQTIRQEPSR